MNEHFQVFVLTHVNIEILVNRSTVFRFQIADTQSKRLLVLTNYVVVIVVLVVIVNTGSLGMVITAYLNVIATLLSNI